MKRFLCALFALALTLFACAESPAYGYIDKKPVFCVYYDETRFELDAEYYKDDSTDEYLWQFDIYDDDLLIDVYIEVLKKDMSLFLLSESEINEYGSGLEKIFSKSGYTGEFKGVKYVQVQNGSRSGRLPFVVLSYSKPGVPVFYYAETLAHGYAICFECFPGETGAYTSEKQRAVLEELLDSFTPII